MTPRGLFAHAEPTGVLSRDLLAELKRGFALDWHGIHGVRHWGRVRRNALTIAATNAANRRVVELFAVFHDAGRWDDGADPSHGARGAALAIEMYGTLFSLADQELALLVAACRGHTGGRSPADVTIQTCWDADRLDLGRIGIRPSAEYLSTEFARRPAVIDWAYRRSRNAFA